MAYAKLQEKELIDGRLRCVYVKGKSKFIKQNNTFINVKQFNNKTKHIHKKQMGGYHLPHLDLKQILEEFKKKFSNNHDLYYKIMEFFTLIASMYDKDAKEDKQKLKEIKEITKILFAVRQKFNKSKIYLNGEKYISFIDALDDLYKHMNEEQMDFIKKKFTDLHDVFKIKEDVLQAAEDADMAKKLESQKHENLSKRTAKAIQMKDELETLLQSENLNDDFKRSIKTIFDMIDNKQNISVYLNFLIKLVETLPILISSQK